MSIYTEQEAYKYLERIAIALEDIETHLKRLANYPPATTAKVQTPLSNVAVKPKYPLPNIPAIGPNPPITEPSSK